MNNKTIEAIKDVYQGELSASETYQQALEKSEPAPGLEPLISLQRHHFEAAETLKNHVISEGDPVPSSSGPWGMWAKTVMGTAKLFGDRNALNALREGEKHGLKQYRDLLNYPLSPPLQSLVEKEFIPRQENHIRTLDTMMQQL